ncbi:MAG: sugar phosphate isomerase/epimerase [Mariniblastus sp.]|jgi:sugar phosphate isomerase/epimerase
MPNSISASELTTYRWSFEQDVQRASELGFDGLAVWRQKLSDFGEEKGAELLAESDLAATSLLWCGGFTGHEGCSFRESIEDAIDAIQTASLLKAPSLIVYSGSRAGHTNSHARRLVQTALSELAGVAAEYGVSLALKPMHPHWAHDCTFLTDLNQALELIDSVGSHWLSLALDTYQWGDSEELLNTLDRFIPFTSVIQVADAGPAELATWEPNRLPPSTGRLPLEAFVVRAIEAGYDGPFEIEVWGETVEGCDYDQLLRQSYRDVRNMIAGAKRVTSTS